jgi:tRNA (cmo5U34)-methyltransferase
MKKANQNFSFGRVASTFRPHIEASIPGYKTRLIPDCVHQSVRFVQPGTNVYDVGCTDGRLLARVRRVNNKARPDVRYIGIDIEPEFSAYWDKHSGDNLRFELRNALNYEFENASAIFSLFTVQFIRPADKAALLKRFYDGLVDGGALFIAEKTLAETPRLQETLNTHYLDYKRGAGFSAEQILDKDRALHGQMTTWTEAELRDALRRAGFRELTPFWRGLFFVGYLALK